MSNVTLQQYFPLIRTREEVLDEISENERLYSIFESWAEKSQEEFLDFCTGVRGVKMLYDGIFKEIMNPETDPSSLNEVLSLLLNKKVQIIEVLPNDNSRLGGESSLLVMDIVVRLEDGSIANIEIQRFGYAFPGQRSACYSADLLLRQYKRVRNRKKKHFSYRDIKDVYVIVFFEKSSSEFHNYPEYYIHSFHQVSNTGLCLPLLQNYFFISLDIFKEHLHNKGIQNKLDGWLTFLGSDSPEDILTLLERFPEFKPLYEHVYRICRNMEDIMGIFSKELEEMDRNTVLYMIDQMQETITEQNNTISEQSNTISEQSNTISEQSNIIAQKEARIKELEALLNPDQT